MRHFEGAIKGRCLQETACRLHAVGQVMGDLGQAPGVVLAGAPGALSGLVLRYVPP